MHQFFRLLGPRGVAGFAGVLRLKDQVVSRPGARGKTDSNPAQSGRQSPSNTGQCHGVNFGIMGVGFSQNLT